MCRDIQWDMPQWDFCSFIQKDAVVTLAIYGVTGPILTKLAHDVATIGPLLPLDEFLSIC